MQGKRTWRQKLGMNSENAALQYLEQQGLGLVLRNYHCRFGEIDLVMQDGSMLVFVEVRFRHSSSHGTAAATVDSRKQARIRLAARHFLYRYKQFQSHCCRFDVLGIQSEQGMGKDFTWIQAAFC